MRLHRTFTKIFEGGRGTLANTSSKPFEKPQKVRNYYTFYGVFPLPECELYSESMPPRGKVFFVF